MLDEELCERYVTTFRCPMQRSISHHLLGCNIRPVLDKDPSDSSDVLCGSHGSWLSMVLIPQQMISSGRLCFIVRHLPQFLVEHGTDAAAKDAVGRTQLYMACDAGREA